MPQPTIQLVLIDRRERSVNMADWLDNDAIAQRTRDRILGRASGVRGRYGRKGILDPQMAARLRRSSRR
jgi:hypothetical protein